ncbi:hypothetical protein [Desulfovibrio inopinatus]|uniref:hypothetical protein n=1 Tax=Desulfovibrio inopinatus TaxID=102109 RepID=UPI000489165D|nr:hypothetical protein [Desulfovibrio inopinatus]
MQSEEVPLHRAVDIVIFMVATLYLSRGSTATIDEDTFHNQTDPVELDQICDLSEEFSAEEQLLSSRLQALSSILKKARF